MTRSEAERELRDEPGYRIEPDRPDYEMMPWREIAITERLARREAEARVKELEEELEEANAYLKQAYDYLNSPANYPKEKQP